VQLPPCFGYQLFGYNRNRAQEALPGAAKPEVANEKVIGICYRSIFCAALPEARTGKQGVFAENALGRAGFHQSRPFAQAIVPPTGLADKAAVGVPESFNPSASGRSSIVSERSWHAAAETCRQSGQWRQSRLRPRKAYMSPYTAQRQSAY
jgi:hypothetical protein